MNFIINLSKSKDSTIKILYDLIITVIDKLKKYIHFISSPKTFNAKQ